MNSCLCEHQVLLACSWPVTALEIDMPARLTDWLLLSSGEEHALLHSPTVWASWECGSCRHCFCIFFFCKYIRMCFAKDNQPIQAREEKLHVHLRTTPKLRPRPSHQVSQARGEAMRNCWTRNEEQSGRLNQESQEWGHRAQGHVQAEQCHSLSPASTCWQGEELLVDWVKTAGTTRKNRNG